MKWSRFIKLYCSSDEGSCIQITRIVPGRWSPELCPGTAYMSATWHRPKWVRDILTTV